MNQKPTKEYCGLTIVLDHPGRFDKERLLAGPAGGWIEDDCIKPFKIANCDIYAGVRPTTFLPGTKFIAWMGLNQTTPCGSNPCGYITKTGSLRHVQTWHPQDSLDPKQYESFGASNDDDDDDAVSDLDSKADYPTKRSNYKFWTARILQKLLNPTQVSYEAIQIKAYPPLAEVIRLLDSTSDDDLYLDIETSPAKRAIQCIGFSTGKSFPLVYVVPCYLYTDRRAYSPRDFFRFHAALSRALQRNTVVIHNSLFDLLILHAWYKFHLPTTVYDTMLAGHRAFPEAEKSLSHNLVQWTELPYHKISSVETFNASQQTTMWNYNAHDVYALKYIKDAQLAHAAITPGLSTSIEQVNNSVIPYLDMTLEGLTVDRVAQLETEQTLTLAKTQYERICRILLANPQFNPGSTKQCAELLHKQLGYPIVGRTDKGAPKLGKKQYYQLLLKHNNPVINAIIAYKKAAKDLSMLAFQLWETPKAPTPINNERRNLELPNTTSGNLGQAPGIRGQQTGRLLIRRSEAT